MLLFTGWFINTEPARPWPDAVPPGTIFVGGPDGGLVDGSAGDGGLVEDAAGDAAPAETDAADSTAP